MPINKEDVSQHILLPHHVEFLKASGISDEVRDARGYCSITKKSNLKLRGFADKQCQTPTLFIPIWNVYGEVALYSHRPDNPRCDPKTGKQSKYEYPHGAHMVVDVHPYIQEEVRDPHVPLIITEGVKKADSAISAGGVCIAVLGVWNWRGTNEYGGKTVLSDWHGVAFKSKDGTPRDIYLAFDSDAMQKRPVHQALEQFGKFLTARGSRVH